MATFFDKFGTSIQPKPSSMNIDIRWQQRFDNFEKAYGRLSVALMITNPSDTERAGIIQFFEITIELVWKTLKDFLISEGFEVKSPREAIKTAFQNGYINDGNVWIDALNNRNLSVHTYDEEMAKELTEKIRAQYFPIIKSFKEWGEQQTSQ